MRDAMGQGKREEARMEDGESRIEQLRKTVIAQRFSAGTSADMAQIQVQHGTAEFFRPALRDSTTAKERQVPALKRWAIVGDQSQSDSSDWV